MQYGQLHRRHRRRPASSFLRERPLSAPTVEPEPPVDQNERNGRSRYRIVRVNGEWVVQMRPDAD
jgi:hypothetical protein